MRLILLFESMPTFVDLTSYQKETQRDDLIYNKIRSMNESNARRNLFTLLKFDNKGSINLSSIKRSALTQVDITTNDGVFPLTTKGAIRPLASAQPSCILGIRFHSF
jgi:hypothetical protein